MDSDSDYKRTTHQPVIAERELIRVGTNDRVTIRIHQPEPGMTPGMPWQCGFSILGLPGIPAGYGPNAQLAAGEAWFADGEDSLHALIVAFIYLRAMIDGVEKEFGVTYAWPPRADWGHMVPRYITQIYGRQYEQRLIEAMSQEEIRLIEARTPNPYPWNDPRHPSEAMRQHQRNLDREELE